jgi:competence protein ComEA
VPDLQPRQLAACVAALVAVLALGGWYLSRAGGGAGPASAPAAIEVQGESAGGRAEGGGSVVVHVAGAVREPGVYRMRADARVDDAVGRAGGATGKADLSQVNLAAKVEDGRQVLVPKRAPAAPAAPSSGGTDSATAGTAPGVPLNLNTATLEQLDQLQGIGPSTAQQIIGYREEHGGFRSVDELDQVPGIGEVRLASLREQVRV